MRRSICSGRRMWLRSNPSDSNSSGKPARMIAASAPLAAATASSMSASSSAACPGSYPAAYTSAPPPPSTAARSASSGRSRVCELTFEEPEPWYRGAVANPPMSATRPLPAPSGSSCPSFLSKTADSAAARRASAWWRACISLPSSLEACAALAASLFRYSDTTRAAARSSTPSSSAPDRTAAAIRASLTPADEGISRSMPARRPLTRLAIAPQSVRRSPSKPHSPRSSVLFSQSCSEHCWPLSLL
mmetsp:Transcript_19810/g.56922  ORF Transcript_19810/g.56922 Transcript_19810/m.56922 type:complete len:246 (+) Transcript_19810:1173-1910(+)